MTPKSRARRSRLRPLVAALFLLSVVAGPGEAAAPKTAPAPSRELLEHALIQLTDTDPVIRDQAVGELERLHDLQSLPSLIRALRDPDIAVRRHVVAAIRGFGSSASPTLLEAFNRPEERSRPTLAILLGAMGTRHLPLLAQGLHHEDAHVRAGCVVGLGETQHPSALTHLVAALDHADPRVRGQVPSALAKLGPTGFPALQRAVTHEDPIVRYHATGLLGALKEPGTIPTLVAALHDPDPQVIELAMLGLCALGPTAASQMLIPLTGAHPMNRSLAMEKIIEYRATSLIPALLNLLRHPTAAHRSAVATIFGGLTSPVTLTALVSVLKDPDPVVRRHTVRSLGSYGPSGLPGLSLAWRDEAAGVRRQVLDALVRISAVATRAFLAEAVRDPDATLRRDLPLLFLQVPRGDAFQDGQDVGVISPLLHDPDPTTRIGTARFIGQRKCPEAVAALRLAAQDSHPAVRQAALEALGWLGELDSDFFSPQTP